MHLCDFSRHVSHKDQIVILPIGSLTWKRWNFIRIVMIRSYVFSHFLPVISLIQMQSLAILQKVNNGTKAKTNWVGLLVTNIQMLVLLITFKNWSVMWFECIIFGATVCFYTFSNSKCDTSLKKEAQELDEFGFRHDQCPWSLRIWA